MTDQDPPAGRTDIPTTWDERVTLATFLDYSRATVHAKCDGIFTEPSIFGGRWRTE